MKDIELRFVERDERNQVDTYTAYVRKIKVLQYRKKYPMTSEIVWSDWQDVPLEVEEEWYGMEMSATALTELEQLLEMENRDGKITLHW